MLGNRKLKCKVCGSKFCPLREDRYTARSEDKSGLVAAFAEQEPARYYDAFDCPQCGCQIRVGERLPHLEEEIEGDDDGEE